MGATIKSIRRHVVNQTTTRELFYTSSECITESLEVSVSEAEREAYHESRPHPAQTSHPIPLPSVKGGIGTRR